MSKKLVIDPLAWAPELLALARIGLMAAPDSKTASAVDLGLRIGGRAVALVQAHADGVETDELTVEDLDTRVDRILRERGASVE